MNSKNISLLNQCLNVQVNEKFFAGYSLTYDLKNLTKLKLMGAFNEKEGLYFARYDYLKKYIVVGCTNSTDHGDRKSFRSHELRYDITAKDAGILGSHATYKYGGEYHLNKEVTLQPRLIVNDKAQVDLQWKQKLNDNLSITCTDQVKFKEPFARPANTTHEFGVALNFTL